MSSHQDIPRAKYYTYAHFRLDDGKCFYIGKGKSSRAWVTKGRSQFWKNVVAKHGYLVQILATWESEEEAFEHEKFLIACFRDMGHPLVNLTDGGEGVSGFKHGTEVRAKISAAASTSEERAARSERQRQRMSSPEARQALVERAKQQWSDPYARQAQAERTSGESSPTAKLSDEACRTMFRLRTQGLPQLKIAAQIGCSQGQVSHILRGKSRRYIYLEFHPEEQ